MVAMPIYGKKHLKIFQESFTEHWGLKVIQVCSNDDTRMTFDNFKARSNLRPYEFVWGKY